jgi:hypothetical protein
MGGRAAVAGTGGPAASRARNWASSSLFPCNSHVSPLVVPVFRNAGAVTESG